MTRMRYAIGLGVVLLNGALAAPAFAANAGDWPCIQAKVGELSYGQMWAGPPLEDAFTKWRDDREVAELVALLAARRTSNEEVGAALDAFEKAAGAEKDEKLLLAFAGVFQRINAERSRVIAGIERYAVKQRELSERISALSLEVAERQEQAADRGAAPEAPTAAAVPGNVYTTPEYQANVAGATTAVPGGAQTPGGPVTMPGTTAAPGTNVPRQSPGVGPGQGASIASLEQQLFWDTRVYDQRNQALLYVCDTPVILDQRAFAMAREIQRRLD